MALTLRQQVKDLRIELKQKESELMEIKTSMKFTKMHELEVDMLLLRVTIFFHNIIGATPDFHRRDNAFEEYIRANEERTDELCSNSGRIEDVTRRILGSNEADTVLKAR